MKKYIILLLCVVAFSPLPAADYRGVDTMALNKAYQELIKNPSSSALQRTYFEQFPSSWNAFYATYRYSTRPGFDKTMYQIAASHIKAFGKLNSIDRKEYERKLVNLSIGGFWDADGPNHLRSLVENIVDKDSENVFQILSTYSAAKQFLFWRFIWENPVKHKSLTERFNRLKQLMGKKYSREVKTMSIAYEYFFGELTMGVDNSNEY